MFSFLLFPVAMDVLIFIFFFRAFAELCKSSQNMSSGPLVEKYLDLHQNMQKAAKVINSLTNDSLSEAMSSFYDGQQCLLPSTRKTKMNKNAVSWVHAALETNLSKFILLKEPEKSEMVNSDKCHYVILGSIPEELQSENQLPQIRGRPGNYGKLSEASPMRVPSSPSLLSAEKKMDPKKDDCPKRSVLKETASLAEKLLLHSREWFFKYMEDSLNNGFQFCRGGDSEIAYLLRQLKRVNQWLDDWGSWGVKVDRRIEDLRKKLYGFLLEHVDIAVASDK